MESYSRREVLKYLIPIRIISWFLLLNPKPICRLFTIVTKWLRELSRELLKWKWLFSLQLLFRCFKYETKLIFIHRTIKLKSIQTKIQGKRDECLEHVTLHFFKVNVPSARLNVPDILKGVIHTAEAIIYHKLYEEIKNVTREKVIQKLPNWLVKFTKKWGAHADLFGEIPPSLSQHVFSFVRLFFLSQARVTTVEVYHAWGVRNRESMARGEIPRKRNMLNEKSHPLVLLK